MMQARLAAFFVVAALALWYPGTSRAAPPVSPDVEVQRLEASYNEGGKLVREPDVDQHLAELIARLAAANPDAAAVTVRVHALRETAPYAFALDNGALYVSTGLIARLANETELAGLIATQIAPLVRHDAATSRETLKSRSATHFIPNLLLVTATIGLAANSLDKADREARDRLNDKLQTDSDALALKWLVQAGFDPREVPRGLERLYDALSDEQRFSSAEFANATLLHRRIESVNSALPPIDAAAAPPTGVAASWWRPMARRFAYEIALADVQGAAPAALSGILKELDAADGASVETTLLRAEWLRRNATAQERLPEVIKAFEACLAYPQPPVRVYRELGFLYRKLGDASRSRANFERYLARAPTAVDAPIIRGYLEPP